ncbi:unnamed protein product [Polarella glacialis]|uniref:Histidine phosphatase family protein n=1 Tax=Polarella glacialis TaxID=89957 RepID=A0A813J691_POLGL|nr:unnamed protein product [Polarella glacialis]CAE8674386.1 unnamed protein product [Polarella glacialis]
MTEAPSRTQQNGAALLEAARGMGLKTLCFVRHANSKPGAGVTRVDQPHDWKIDDQKRMLTEKGWDQCRSASKWFADVDCRAILSSPARRAADTAVAMKDQVEKEGAVAHSLPVGMVDAVHPAGTSEACELLFETKGYGPLRGFFEAPGGEVAFKAYGELAAGRILDHLKGGLMGEAVAADGTPAGTCLAVFGHAVFLNAIAHVVAEAAGGAGLDLVLDMDLGETQGVLVSLADGKCTHLSVSTTEAPSPTQQNGAALLEAARGMGLKTLCFVRHANSKPGAGVTRVDQPHDWKIDDQKRMLTEKGWDQCRSASKWFADVDCRAILSSPARRAADTAVAMKDQVEKEGAVAHSLPVGMVDAVHPAGTSEACELLFETKGYGPLRGFFEAPGGEVAFKAYGELAAGRILDHLKGGLMGEAVAADGTPAGTCLAVFGHAVFLNAIAHVVAEAAGGAGLDLVLDMDLGETQGVLVSLADGKCTHLSVS